MIKYSIILFLSCSSFLLAQEKYLELVRADFKAEKVKLISEAMKLSDEESSKFWPIYREFDLEKSKNGDEKFILIKDYGANYNNMDNKKADEIISRLFDLKEKELDLKKEYYKKMSKALSPLLAAKFIQVINAIDNFIDVQIAAQLPLIGEDSD